VTSYSLISCCIHFFLSFYVYSSVGRTGMAGVPGTASAIFGAVKDVGANVIVISQVLFIPWFQIGVFLR